MKKVLILCVGVLAFACNSGSNNTAGEDVGNINSAENVEENSQENISPQLNTEEGTDNSRLEVDTIRSAESAQEQKQD